MDYKKKYEEAIERATKLKETCDSTAVIGWCEYIFPELKESEDEKLRKSLIKHFRGYQSAHYDGFSSIEVIAWLEKQGQSKKTSIWKHWKDGIAGNGNGEPVYLIKDCSTYSLSSVLSFECDYIELSELNNLMLEKQGEPKTIWHNAKEKPAPSEKDILGWYKQANGELERNPKIVWFCSEEEAAKEAESHGFHLAYWIELPNEKFDKMYWFEKQGENPAPIDIDKMVYKYGNTKEDCTDDLPVNCQIRAYRQGINDTLNLVFNLEKQGQNEQIPANSAKTCKNAWSEEDEELLNSLVKEIESELKKPYFEGYDLICNKKISWLKSLKGRLSL